jgi:hypothetical protein
MPPKSIARFTPHAPFYREQIDAAAKRCALLSADKHPFTRQNARVTNNHLFQPLLIGEVYDREWQRLLTYFPDCMFDRHREWPLAERPTNLAAA